MFPPVIIHIAAHNGTYDEAHVDGTASVPFIVPSAFLRIVRTAKWLRCHHRLCMSSLMGD